MPKVNYKPYLDQRLGKGWKGPFTGLTSRVFDAWCHLCDAWYTAGENEKRTIERSMESLIELFQTSELHAAKAAIGAAGNEQDEQVLWSRVFVK